MVQRTLDVTAAALQTGHLIVDDGLVRSAFGSTRTVCPVRCPWLTGAPLRDIELLRKERALVMPDELRSLARVGDQVVFVRRNRKANGQLRLHNGLARMGLVLRDGADERLRAALVSRLALGDTEFEVLEQSPDDHEYVAWRRRWETAVTEMLHAMIRVAIGGGPALAGAIDELPRHHQPEQYQTRGGIAVHDLAVRNTQGVLVYGSAIRRAMLDGRDARQLVLLLNEMHEHFGESVPLPRGPDVEAVLALMQGE